MNKFAILGLFALSACFTACDDYEEPNPPAQSNPQESVLKTNDIQVSNLMGEAVYDLQALNNEDRNIEVAVINTDQLPSGYQFGVVASISADEFANSYPVEAIVIPSPETNSWVVSVSPVEIEAVYKTNITRQPDPADIGIRFQLTTVSGNQVAYVGGPEFYYGPYDMKIVPFSGAYVIEEAYYLVGSFCDWDVKKAYKFSHSSINQYDDPQFSLSFEITADQAAAGWSWKVIPQSTVDAGQIGTSDYSQFGVDAADVNSQSGTLVANVGGISPVAGTLTVSGPWKMVINMQNLTYEFMSAVELLYTPGDINAWSPEGSMALSTSNYETYTGYAIFNSGGFKFTSAPDWNHVNYGSTGTPGELTTDGSAGNLTVETEGLYWCNVNTVNLTYSLTLIETIGLIGDATEQGWDASTPLTSTDFITWTGDVKLKEGEFKFRCNNGWDINLGGESYTDLVQDGANLKSPGEGTYTVTLNLGALPYSCTLVKK